jgi:hypothetical protein
MALNSPRVPSLSRDNISGPLNSVADEKEKKKKKEKKVLPSPKP